MSALKHPWPCVVLRTRYGGVYEGGEWVALMCWPEHIPLDVYGDDVNCARFFKRGREETPELPEFREAEIGRGNTADEAVADLERRLDKEGVQWR